MKLKLILSVFLIGIGITTGVVINLSFNHKPSPALISAASSPTPKPTATPTLTPTPKPTAIPTPTPTPSYSISGFVFIDTNDNGKHNAQDSNYTPGATVSASLNNSIIGTMQTGANGKYSFTGLQNGSYNISLTTPDKYSNTTPNPVEVTIDNQNETSVKFGIFPNDWMIKTNEKSVLCSDLRSFVHDHCE